MKVLNGDKQDFNIPTKPKVKLKPAPPDQRQIAVMPIKALTDRKLNGGCVRVLALISSYCNRAGITWVGQERLARDLQTNKQYISRMMGILRDAGYIETLTKGAKNSHTATTRVIYNKSINHLDAIALVNEESRSPQMIKQEEKYMEEMLSKGSKRARKTIKLPVKAEALEVIKKAKVEVMVDHNNCEAIVQSIYRSVFFKDKLINDLDLKGFELIAMCQLKEQMLSRDLELWLKARPAEPDSIIDFARALMDENCSGT
jgi:DNA-binding IscR family transcriptional regulator